MAALRWATCVAGAFACDRALNLVGHVLDRLELVHVEAGALPLVGLGLGDEAELLEVRVGGGDRGDALAGAVMVGHHQPAGGHERGRAVGQPHRGEADVVEPGLPAGVNP